MYFCDVFIPGGVCIKSNAHSSTPFFGKHCFSSKYVLVTSPLSKFLEVCLNSELMMMKSNFYTAWDLKKPFSGDVAFTTTLPNSYTYKGFTNVDTRYQYIVHAFIRLCFDIFFLNKLNCCKTYQGIWRALHNFIWRYRKNIVIKRYRS